MKWSITIDQANRFTGRWERVASEVFTGDVDDVVGQVSFEGLGCGWSSAGEPRRVHRLGNEEVVVAVTLSEGGWVVTATRLP